MEPTTIEQLATAHGWTATASPGQELREKRRRARDDEFERLAPVEVAGLPS